MRVRLVIFALEAAALIGFYVLIGLAFGWVIGLVFGLGFLAFAAVSWGAAKVLAKRFDKSS